MDFDLLSTARHRFDHVPSNLVKAGMAEKLLDGSVWYKLRIDCKDPATEKGARAELARKMTTIGSVARYGGASGASFLVVRVSAA